MGAAVATRPQNNAATVEQVLIRGDLAALPEQERIRYYHQVCTSVGLNPLTQPFAYITLNGKLTLYALRACTDQLRSIHNVSVEELMETERDGVFIVTAKVRNKDGRTDISKGAVNIASLKGEALANALMKAETKAKRRATLSICGLGMLDESELDTIPHAAASVRPAPQPTPIAPVHVDPPHNPETGEVLAPHTIPVEGTGVQWGAKLIAAFKAASTTDELHGWMNENDAALDALEKSAPKAYASVVKAFHARLHELAVVDEPPAPPVAAAATDPLPF